MINYKLIGQRLRDERKRNKYKQKEIAEILDLSDPYVSKIENGNTTLSLKRLDQLCNIYKCDIGYILTGTNYCSDMYLIRETYSLFEDCSPEKRDFLYNIAKQAKNIDLPAKESAK